MVILNSLSGNLWTSISLGLVTGILLVSIGDVVFV